MGTETPAGWYAAPDASDLLRYWDGEMWTEQARPAPIGRGGPSTGPTGAPTLKIQSSSAVREALRPGEQIEAGFHSGTLRTRYFVATTMRVIVVVPKGLRANRNEVTTIEYADITSVGVRVTGYSAPRLHLASRTGGFTGTNSETTLHDFARYVRQRMPRSGPVDLAELPKPQAPAPPTVPSPDAAPTVPTGGDNFLGQMKELTSMYSNGLLTEDEFTAAKAKLLEA